ncbi:MAG: mannose-1-phosphate guanylyltransferase [Thermoguttaceae bacterium]
MPTIEKDSHSRSWERVMLHGVVMAGGAGTRLWPASRKELPKQFLAFGSDKAMLAATLDRVSPLIPRSQMLVVTATAMEPLVRNVAPELAMSHILCESAPRNTAPCIGWAAVTLLAGDPDATMVVLPADHVIAPREIFCETLSFAAALVDESPERLVTIGIQPTFAATSYGYIQCGSPLVSDVASRSTIHAWNVTRFHEKPPQPLAEDFLAAGNFRWNAGIFVWKAATILRQLERHEPEMAAILHDISKRPNDAATLFPQMNSISIDNAVLERAESIVALDATFTWDDVGTWRSLERLYADKRDATGNVAIDTTLIPVESHNNVVRRMATTKNDAHVVALIGVNDLIVVETDDALLIVHKDHEERVREVAAGLRCDQ